MALFPIRRRDATIDGTQLPSRTVAGRGGKVAVNEETAWRHSAVWACLRQRADLVSSLPLDCFREMRADVDGVSSKIAVEVPKPPVLVEPGGPEWDYVDWMYASQVDLDRAGNAIGIITERNALNLPARIELQPINMCTVVVKKGEKVPRYRIDGKDYTRDEIWHERQYVVSGLPVGLSPVAYAAWSIGEYLNAGQFALDWFGGGGVPKARLKNTMKVLKSREAASIKERWHATVADGDIFVHGSDWEYDLMQAEQMGAEWLESRRFSLPEICRFFGCPADLIDAAISAPGSITYQGAVQRNLQFLIMQFGPAAQRREKNLTKLLPKPRYVKLNTAALLRLDDETRWRVIAERIKSRTLTVSEARALENQPPLTAEQEAEFVRLFGAPREASPTESSRAVPYWEQVSPYSAVPYPTGSAVPA